jgi:hypothetical protein
MARRAAARRISTAAGSRQRGEGQRHREEMADGRCSEGDGEAKDADAVGPNSKASTVCGGAGRAKVEEMEAQDADAVGVEFAGGAHRSSWESSSPSRATEVLVLLCVPHRVPTLHLRLQLGVPPLPWCLHLRHLHMLLPPGGGRKWLVGAERDGRAQVKKAWVDRIG